MMLDDEISSLFSLLGLLEGSEYFVTVDHSALWQKHISWAKSGGNDLRQHITQGYASSMVFLSCLLAAQINVFFNSSEGITTMRACLATQKMYTLKYWIGVVIMSDICITILALVSTYTLSKLIASISDSNAHAMLRSSIGSYVAVLPSRFTVAAMYLFLLWIAMFIWEIFAGPIHYFLLLAVLMMFFHVIIPLSAFGRLIIHTGAMGKRPVLDVELEKELLPSGLHTSLLIRATDRKRKYKASATDQYRKGTAMSKTQRSRHSSSVPSLYGTSIPSASVSQNHHPQSMKSSRPPQSIAFQPRTHERNDDGDHDASRDLSSEDEDGHHKNHTNHKISYAHDDDSLYGLSGGDHEAFNEDDDELSTADPESLLHNYGSTGYHYGGQHRRMQTVDTVGSDNFFFPQASILNATIRTQDISNIVKQSMILSESGNGHPPRLTLRDQSLGTTSGSLTTDGTVDGGDDALDAIQGLAIPLSTPEGIPVPLPASTPAPAPAKHPQPLLNSGHTLPPPSSRVVHTPSPSALSAPSAPFPRQVDHPLLTSPFPPKHPAPRSGRRHHRRRSSISLRSSGSILGFVPSPHAAEELKEENEIRASLDMPLAPDLESQERLLDEQSQQDFRRPTPEAVASTWLNSHHQSPTTKLTINNAAHSQQHYRKRGSERAQRGHVRRSSAPTVGRSLFLSPEQSQSSTYGSHSNRRRSGSRSSLLGRQLSEGRNLMATIESHPGEENSDYEDDTTNHKNANINQTKKEQDNDDSTKPEETTRLLP